MHVLLSQGIIPAVGWKAEAEFVPLLSQSRIKRYAHAHLLLTPPLAPPYAPRSGM